MYFEGKATIPKLTAIFDFWSRLSLSTPCNIKQQVGVKAHDPHLFLGMGLLCHALGTVTGEDRHESCRLLTWQGCDNLMVWCVARGDLSDALQCLSLAVSQAIWLLFCIGQRLGIHRTLGWVKLSHTQFTQVSAERRLNTLRSFSAPTHSEMSDLIALWNFNELYVFC